VGFLTSRGYDIINLSLFDIAGQTQFYSDRYFWPAVESIWSFYYSRTIIAAIFDRYHHNADINSIKDINFKIIDRLKEIPREYQNKPKFVYAHLMMPYPPFIFDANGKMHDWASSPGYDPKRQYLQQLMFTDKILMNVVDIIISNSKRPPVIILQGDHGSRLVGGRDRDKEAFSILNSYYLPNCNRKDLYRSISPVNTFRFVFNKYFHQNYDYIEDKHYPFKGISFASFLPK
jgi:hypothetical protein